MVHLLIFNQVISLLNMFGRLVSHFIFKLPAVMKGESGNVKQLELVTKWRINPPICNSPHVSPLLYTFPHISPIVSSVSLGISQGIFVSPGVSPCLLF